MLLEESTELELISGMMDLSIRVIGWKIKSVELGFILGWMGESMKDFIKTIKNTVSVYIPGQMVVPMMAIGSRASSTVSDNTWFQKKIK